MRMLLCVDVYYASFPEEPWLYKAVVYSIYVLETVVAISITYDLGHMIIDPCYIPLLPCYVIPIGGGAGMSVFPRSEAKAENWKWYY